MCELALQLPNSFVDIDRDEMEYVDGGVYVTNRWYGTDFYFGPGECNDIAAGVAALIPGVNAAVVPLITIGAGLLGIGSSIFWQAGNHNGLNVTILFAGLPVWSINW